MTVLDPLTFTVEVSRDGFFIADEEGLPVESRVYLNAKDAFDKLERLIVENEDARREH